MKGYFIGLLTGAFGLALKTLHINKINIHIFNMLIFLISVKSNFIIACLKLYFRESVPKVSTLKYKDGLNLGVGTSSGQVGSHYVQYN